MLKPRSSTPQDAINQLYHATIQKTLLFVRDHVFANCHSGWDEAVIQDRLHALENSWIQHLRNPQAQPSRKAFAGLPALEPLEAQVKEEGTGAYIKQEPGQFMINQENAPFVPDNSSCSSSCGPYSLYNQNSFSCSSCSSSSCSPSPSAYPHPGSFSSCSSSSCATSSSPPTSIPTLPNASGKGLHPRPPSPIKARPPSPTKDPKPTKATKGGAKAAKPPKEPKEPKGSKRKRKDSKADVKNAPLYSDEEAEEEDLDLPDQEEEDQFEDEDLGPADDDPDDRLRPILNTVQCQFVKRSVSRRKTRWRCKLTNGLARLNGIDYCFKTADGDFIWN